MAHGTGGDMLAAVSCIFVLLRLCSAEGLICSVTQHRNQTTYIIEGRVLDANATNCEHMWADANDVSIKNNGGKSDPVKTQRVDMLGTADCLEKVVFTRNCVSEVIEYRVNCTTICGEHAPSLGEKGTVSWIVPTVVVLLVVLLMAGLLYFWYRKSKNKDHRMSCQTEGYTGV